MKSAAIAILCLAAGTSYAAPGEDSKFEGIVQNYVEALLKNHPENATELGEAAGKWRRAILTSAQLSTYYVGNIEMNEIRAGWEKKHGRGELKKLHDTMLSFGSPAAKYVKEMMGL